jgi:hypothetical protein
MPTSKIGPDIFSYLRKLHFESLLAKKLHISKTITESVQKSGSPTLLINDEGSAKLKKKAIFKFEDLRPLSYTRLCFTSFFGLLNSE